MTQEPSAFFDTAQLARWLGVSKRTVERMRADDSGPPVNFFRGRARYEKALALDWARANNRRPRKHRSLLQPSSEPSSLTAGEGAR